MSVVKNNGREIMIGDAGSDVSVKVSGSRTVVTIDGKKAKRSTVKTGMTYIFTRLAPDADVRQVGCAN